MQPQFVPIPKVWIGERVFVIGGGPSAKTIDWEKLRGQKVLACNAAAFLLPDRLAQYAVFGDKPFLQAFRPRLREYVDKGGFLLNLTGRTPEPMNHWMFHVERVNGSKNWGISTDPDRVRWNRSTGGCAVNVAYLLGAREIVLIGFDMSALGKSHNWHKEYEPHYANWTSKTPAPITLPKPLVTHYKNHFAKAFGNIRRDLDWLKVPLWNTFEGSLLVESGLTPFRPLEELL